MQSMAILTEPRVFLDTNVIFSGLYSPHGAPGKILDLFIQATLHVIISQQVLEEVVRTFKEKLPEALPALNRFLVNSPPEVVANPSREDIEKWIGLLPMADAAIFAAAVQSESDYFVTGDNHFTVNRELAEKTGLHICTPTQFLDIIKRRQDSWE